MNGRYLGCPLSLSSVHHALDPYLPLSHGIRGHSGGRVENLTPYDGLKIR